MWKSEISQNLKYYLFSRQIEVRYALLLHKCNYNLTNFSFLIIHFFKKNIKLSKIGIFRKKKIVKLIWYMRIKQTFTIFSTFNLKMKNSWNRNFPSKIVKSKRNLIVNKLTNITIFVKISNFQKKKSIFMSKTQKIVKSKEDFFYRPFHQFWRKISVQNLMEHPVHSRKWALDLEKAGFECQVISADVQSGKSTSRICYPKQVKVVSGNRNWNHEFIG